MISNQLSWTDRIRHSLARERESDAFDRTSDDDSESTFWTRADVERLHAEFAQRLLRILPAPQVEQMGGTADGVTPRLGIVRRDFSDGDTIERGFVRVIAATIQQSATLGDPFLPARGPVTPAEWVQMAPLTNVSQLSFTVLGGVVRTKGHLLRLLYVVEPALTDFQSNAVFLPPAGYFEMACDWVHQMLTAADKFPIGRG